MATTSPAIRDHLGGKIWQEHITEDEATPQTLVLECFSIMIDEVYELGIEFFCTRTDLCDSLYTLDKVLLLFEVIYPTPLYRSIAENDGFRTWLTATVRDAAGDPDLTTAMDLLHYLAIDYPDAGDTFQETFVLLHDKLRSTPVFDGYVLSILAAHTAPFEAPVDPEAVIGYLNHVRDQRSRLLKAIDRLAGDPELRGLMPIQYNRLNVYTANATAAGSIATSVWRYGMTGPGVSPTPLEQALLVRFTREFESITPLYVDYFQLQARPLTRDDVVSLILGVVETTATRDAFTAGVDTAFRAVAGLLPPADPGIHIFMTSVCMRLVQEFYP
jgi:hypothetical protein